VKNVAKNGHGLGIVIVIRKERQSGKRGRDRPSLRDRLWLREQALFSDNLPFLTGLPFLTASLF
jgi:hypothetical protein